MKEPRFVREFRSYVVLKISGSDLDEASKKILVNKAYSSLDFLGRGMITVEEPCAFWLMSWTMQPVAKNWRRKMDRQNKMYHIVFEYADAMSGWKWKRQECYVSSLRQCIELYGLGKDCDYRLVSVEEVER